MGPVHLWAPETWFPLAPSLIRPWRRWRVWLVRRFTPFRCAIHRSFAIFFKPFPLNCRAKESHRVTTLPLHDDRTQNPVATRVDRYYVRFDGTLGRSLMKMEIYFAGPVTRWVQEILALGGNDAINKLFQKAPPRCRTAACRASPTTSITPPAPSLIRRYWPRVVFFFFTPSFYLFRRV